MAKPKRSELSSPAEPADKRARSWFDVVLRLLTVAALIVFVAGSLWNFQQMRQQLDRIEQNRVEHLYWQLTRPGTLAAERTDAFLRLVAAGNREWPATNLSDLDLEGASLQGASLRSAVFRSCNLKKANLQGADLYKAGFETCDLSGANFQNADMREALLFKNESFKDANLQSAKLTAGSLQQSTLVHCNLQQAELTDGDLRLTIVRDCDLRDADLIGANLADAVFVRTNLKGARLFRATLGNVNFKDSNWWRALGIPLKTIEDYKKRFPPSETAKKEFREDWELWLKTGGK